MTLVDVLRNERVMLSATCAVLFYFTLEFPCAFLNFITLRLTPADDSPHKSKDRTWEVYK